MAAGDAGTAARVERTGLAFVKPENGLAALSAGEALLHESTLTPPYINATSICMIVPVTI